MPGVLAIYTAADLAAYGPLKWALDFKQRNGDVAAYVALDFLQI